MKKFSEKNRNALDYIGQHSKKRNCEFQYYKCIKNHTWIGLNSEELVDGKIVFASNKPSTFAAHFDCDNYTDDELDEIKQFAEFVKGKRAK